MSGQLPPWAAQAGATPEGLAAYRRRRQMGAPLGEEPITLNGQPVGGMQANTPDQGQNQTGGTWEDGTLPGGITTRTYTPDPNNTEFPRRPDGSPNPNFIAPRDPNRARVRGGGRGGQTASNRGGGNTVASGPAPAPGSVNTSETVTANAPGSSGSVSGTATPRAYGGGASGRPAGAPYDPAAAAARRAAELAAKGGGAPAATPMPAPAPPRPRRPQMSASERAAAVAADQAMFQPGGSQSTLPAPPTPEVSTTLPEPVDATVEAVPVEAPPTPMPPVNINPQFNPNQLNPRFPVGAPPFNPNGDVLPGGGPAGGGPAGGGPAGGGPAGGGPQTPPFNPDPNAMKQALMRGRVPRPGGGPRPGGSGPFAPPNPRQY